jgi:hypothetical protein
VGLALGDDGDALAGVAIAGGKSQQTKKQKAQA